MDTIHSGISLLESRMLHTRQAFLSEKGPAAGFGVSVMTQERPLGVPGGVSSTNHAEFRNRNPNPNRSRNPNPNPNPNRNPNVL